MNEYKANVDDVIIGTTLELAASFSPNLPEGFGVRYSEDLLWGRVIMWRDDNEEGFARALEDNRDVIMKAARELRQLAKEKTLPYIELK